MEWWKGKTLARQEAVQQLPVKRLRSRRRGPGFPVKRPAATATAGCHVLECFRRPWKTPFQAGSVESSFRRIAGVSQRNPPMRKEACLRERKARGFGYLGFRKSEGIEDQSASLVMRRHPVRSGQTGESLVSWRPQKSCGRAGWKRCYPLSAVCDKNHAMKEARTTKLFSHSDGFFCHARRGKSNRGNG